MMGCQPSSYTFVGSKLIGSKCPDEALKTHTKYKISKNVDLFNTVIYVYIYVYIYICMYIKQYMEDVVKCSYLKIYIYIYISLNNYPSLHLPCVTHSRTEEEQSCGYFCSCVSRLILLSSASFCLEIRSNHFDFVFYRYVFIISVGTMLDDHLISPPE